jgi:uncharacterized membrane protein YeaQ/YmgE (transglycosylase-associated protein family)
MGTRLRHKSWLCPHHMASVCLRFRLHSPSKFAHLLIYKSVNPEGRSEDTQDESVGWVAAIIIGGIAGWLAEYFMKSPMGLLMNIVLGIVGAAVASFLFSFLDVTLSGWLGYLLSPPNDRTRSGASASCDKLTG